MLIGKPIKSIGVVNVILVYVRRKNYELALHQNGIRTVIEKSLDANFVVLGQKVVFR
tara:strand:+ start:326 stop:496 length:171 start_codon:yes stop_codon:yes gene_type:complete